MRSVDDMLKDIEFLSREKEKLVSYYENNRDRLDEKERIELKFKILLCEQLIKKIRNLIRHKKYG